MKTQYTFVKKVNKIKHWLTQVGREKELTLKTAVNKDLNSVSIPLTS